MALGEAKSHKGINGTLIKDVNVSNKKQIFTPIYKFTKTKMKVMEKCMYIQNVSR